MDWRGGEVSSREASAVATTGFQTGRGDLCEQAVVSAIKGEMSMRNFSNRVSQVSQWTKGGK